MKWLIFISLSSRGSIKDRAKKWNVNPFSASILGTACGWVSMHFVLQLYVYNLRITYASEQFWAHKSDQGIA